MKLRISSESATYLFAGLFSFVALSMSHNGMEASGVVLFLILAWLVSLGLSFMVKMRAHETDGTIVMERKEIIPTIIANLASWVLGGVTVLAVLLMAHYDVSPFIIGMFVVCSWATLMTVSLLISDITKGME